MTPSVQVGTVLVEDSLMTAKILGLESEPYSGNWGLIKALDGFAIDRKIRLAGWNFFFMAAEIKVMFFGTLQQEKIKSALQRILVRVKGQNFNSLEVTAIAAKRFWGVPYSTVSAHSRHIQEELLPRQGRGPPSTVCQ